MKNNALYTGIFFICFSMNANAQSIPGCPDGTTTCTISGNQEHNMGETSVVNDHSSSQATQVNPSSNSVGGSADVSAEQKAQNSGYQQQDINGHITNGSDQAYAKGGDSSSKGNETSVSTGANSLKQGNTGDQTATAKGGNVGDTTAKGGAGGSAGVDGSGNSRAAGGAATGGASGSLSGAGASSTNDNRQFTSSTSNSKVIYRGDMHAVTQPILPVAVAGSAVQFVPGTCGPKMKVEREWVQVGKKKHQGYYTERLAGIDTANPFTHIEGVKYGYVYTGQTSVNSAANNGGLQLGGMGGSGAAGQFGIGSAAAGQAQQTTFVERVCELTPVIAQVPPSLPVVVEPKRIRE